MSTIKILCFCKEELKLKLMQCLLHDEWFLKIESFQYTCIPKKFRVMNETETIFFKKQKKEVNFSPLI